MQLIYLIITLAIFALDSNVCQSIENDVINETTQKSNPQTKKVNIEDIPYYEDIKNLSNNELEAICTDRGFEIVKDNTGQKANHEYTRQDYLIAASQCLLIEGEMAKVIEEHPEILQELKEETNQMSYQKALLEKELSDAQAQLNSLKQKENKEDDPALFINPNTASTEEDNKSQDSEIDMKEEEEVIIPPVSDDTDSNEKENVTPVHSKPKVTVEKDSDGTDIEVIDLDDTSESIPQEEAKMSETTSSDSTINTDNVEINDEKGADTSKTTTSSEEESPPNTKPAEKVESIGITNINPANHTLSDIVNEVNAQILRDIRLVFNTLLPEHIRTPLLQVLQPFLKVGKESLNTVVDMFLRYVNVLMKTVKDEVKNRHKKFMQQQQE